ncbi:MAG TPA: HNH endonuclease [Stellaceae bacterium]|nr:HNH endonuclease [Stellaceae bacterium]
MRRPGRAARRTLMRALLARDNGRCRLCGRAVAPGAPAPEDRATIGHIWPHALGGEASLANTRIECAACNEVHGLLPRW